MDERLTIEELAAASGMTVRNIREHQTRGLLDPPTVEGRKGFYGSEHLERLRLIRELQDEGLNLRAIRWLIERAPSGAAAEVARFERALFAPWTREETEVRTTEELVALTGEVPTHVRRRAQQLGLIRPAGAGRWEVPSPRLLEAARDLREVGVSIEAALDVVEALDEHAEAISRAFVDLFVEEVWQPFDAAGRPGDRWGEIRAALERLRPVATDALLAVFARAMEAAVADRAAELAIPGGGEDRPRR